MAFAALSAIAAGLTAATAAGTAVVGSQNAQAANKTQAGIAANNQQNSVNQQAYAQALNALAMRRGVAGSTDSRGDTSTYDPATNSWKTLLSPSGQAIQSANDTASIRRNTTDLNTAEDANNQAMLGAIKARGAAGSALSDVQNFRPMSSNDLEGALQETATTANNNAERPIIADTLRQFARTGTAAGPVLTQMMRDNAGSLRTTMLQDKLAAMKNVGDINNTNRAGLVDTYSKLNQAGNPQLTFPNLSTNSPNDFIAAEANSRANGAAQPASTGAYSTGANTAQSNAAGEFAALHPGITADPSGLVGGATSSIKGLFDPNGAIAKYFNSGSGNAGDKASSNGGAFGVDNNTNPFAGMTY